MNFLSPFTLFGVLELVLIGVYFRKCKRPVLSPTTLRVLIGARNKIRSA